MKVKALQIAGANLQCLVQPGVPPPGEGVAEPSGRRVLSGGAVQLAGLNVPLADLLEEVCRFASL